MGPHILKPLAALLAVAAVSLDAAAQSRKDISLTSPGTLRAIGAGQYYFNRYSYGLGALETAPGPGGDVLKSSLGDPGNFLVTRWPQATAPDSSSTGIGGSSDLSRSRVMMETPDPGALAIPMSGILQPGASVGSAAAGALAPGGSGVVTIEDIDRLALSVTREYIKSIEASSVLLNKKAGTITSLVPETDSLFSVLLLKGEKAFRDGRFNDAVDQFKFANDLNSRVPESLVSLAHASFAVSRYSYGRAAFYLKEALKYFPELPLTPLRPKQFYGNDQLFVEHLLSLEDHVERHPDDVDALLVLSYFRWFQDDPAVNTVKARLAQALRGATKAGDQRSIEAIDTFWAGVVASGKDAGEPRAPTTLPAAGATTRPAAPEKTGAEQARAGTEAPAPKAAE